MDERKTGGSESGGVGKMRLIVKLILVTIVLGFMYLVVLDSNTKNTNVCNEYFNIECDEYSRITSECFCEGSYFHLDNEMIEKKNSLIRATSYSGAYVPINFSLLEFSNLSEINITGVDKLRPD